MKTVILSFIYPAVTKYLPQFLDSLNLQSDKNFMLYIVNDGVNGIKHYLNNYKIDYKIKDASGLPATLRKVGIDWAIQEGYESIIFADSDDCFDKNRVNIVKKLLKEYEIVFNELDLFWEDVKETIPLLNKRFSEGDKVRIKDLLHFNCLGLSNTALRTEIIDKNFKNIPDDTIAFDWALYSLLLYKGYKAFFTKQTTTYYRQYDNNIAAPFSYEDNQILRGIKVKSQHYYTLSFLDNWYKQQANEYNVLSQEINDEKFRLKYLEAVREQAPKNPLWWESIKTKEVLGL